MAVRLDYYNFFVPDSPGVSQLVSDEREAGGRVAVSLAMPGTDGGYTYWLLPFLPFSVLSGNLVRKYPISVNRKPLTFSAIKTFYKIIFLQC